MEIGGINGCKHARNTSRSSGIDFAAFGLVSFHPISPSLTKFRRLFLVCLFWLILVASGDLLRAQQAGSLDAGFNPGYGVDGDVNALAVQADGKILVAGQFSHVNGQAQQNLARLNPDGSLDPAFQAPVLAGTYSSDPAYLNAVAVQPDGRLLVGGVFTQVGGEAHAGLVRLNADGSVDSSFAPSFGRLAGVYHTHSVGVYALAVQADGKIVAVGAFSSVNGQARRGVARLNADGTLDAAFDPAAPANVYPPQGLSDDAFSLALGPGGEVYVGGNFATINGVSRPVLARLRADNGNLDASFAPAAIDRYASVNALACQVDGDLLVAGAFVQPGGSGLTLGGLTRFAPDGSPDTAFFKAHGNGPYDSSAIAAILVQPDGAILVAGSHLYLDGQAFGALGRYLPTGKVDKTFYPGLDPLSASGVAPTETALALRPDGSVAVGGTFDAVDGALREHLAGLRGSPSADCPLVSVLAKVPTAVVPGVASAAITEQAGAFQIKVNPPSTLALTVHYSLSGAGTSLATSDLTNSTSIVIRDGKRKAKLLVMPNSAAAYGVGQGKNLKVELEAGRGYAVQRPDSAKVRFVPALSSGSSN